jgi:hypothetical protein
MLDFWNEYLSVGMTAVRLILKMVYHLDGMKAVTLSRRPVWYLDVWKVADLDSSKSWSSVPAKVRLMVPSQPHLDSLKSDTSGQWNGRHLEILNVGQ